MIFTDNEGLYRAVFVKKTIEIIEHNRHKSLHQTYNTFI